MPRVNGPRAKLIVAIAAVAGMLTVSGCELLSPDPDLDNGRELFIQQCGTCHILAEAGTTADIGPDLDAAFADARSVGMTEDTVAGVTRTQIANPRETDPDDPTYMPADLVTGDDAHDVAAYVGEVAGVPDIEPPEAPGGPGGQVFANYGCGACHVLAAAETGGTTGPNLDEVLPDRTPAEIETAILDPDAIVTEGFAPGIMPAFEGVIPPDELELLVEFLAESAGQNGNGNGGGNGGGQDQGGNAGGP
jgi:mono/diheme cytochrome c family protein